jgi:putative FmdB family regulatory protein
MPIYTYRCADCAEVTDAYRSVAERDNCPPCEVCGGKTKKIIAPYRVHSDMEPYYDWNLDTYVKSRKHRKKVMREKGVEEKFGKGWM